jgi:hypothetical protein
MKRAVFLGMVDDEEQMMGELHQPFEIGAVIQVVDRGSQAINRLYPWRVVGTDDILRDSEIRIIEDVEVNLDDYL